MWTYNYSRRLELYHYGVLGMKWGVRRTREQLGYRRAAGIFGRGKRKTGEESEPGEFASLADLPKIKGSHTLEEDAIAVNPNFKKSNLYQWNCIFCVGALELRRRGFDVEALPIKEWPHSVQWEKLFKKEKVSRVISGKGVSEIPSKIAEWGEGARGIVQWENEGGWRHVFSVEVQSGKAKFIDPQNPEQDTDEFFKHHAKFRLARVDNLEPDETLLPIIKKRGDE
jgi:hypothetical protein